MSAQFISIGDRIDHTPSGNVAVGAVVAVGGLLGVATTAIPANTLGVLNVEGTFELELASGKTFSIGDAVYVDDSEATDSGTFFGYAVSDSAGGVVKAKLVQSPPAAGS
jgi:predicted RecA/RadA family phage recombinase